MQPQWQGLGKVQFSNGRASATTTSCFIEAQLPFELTPERVRLLCDRNVGIGSDGILLIGARLGEARFGLRIFNPDGGEAEMCGNGVRMVARKLKMEGSIEGDTVVLETAPERSSQRSGPAISSRSTWGSPASAERSSPASTTNAFEESLNAAGRSFTFTFVDVGNPHAVIQSPWPLELVPLHEVGPMIEEHRFFPRKANVEFVKVIGEHRGQHPRVGTRCGGDLGLRDRRHGHRGSARAYRSVFEPFCDRQELPGGKLEVEVRPDWRVFMTGPAEEIYHGDLSSESWLMSRVRRLGAAP